MDMNALAEELLTLVKIPSVSGQEKELADHLEGRLNRTAVPLGNRLIRMEDSLVLIPESADLSRPLIVLAGHIDTVPQEQAPDPAFEGGRIIGRGSADMKAGVTVMLHLAGEIPARAGFAARAYVFYTGEEGSAAGNALPRILKAHPALARADLALLLEPTAGDLELGCNGSIHVEVTFRGRACHSARPWAGVHPLVSALPWLEKILHQPIRAVEIEGAVFREVTSLTCLRSGDARNVIPGTLTVNLNLRYAPDRDPEEAESFALSLCPAEGAAEVHLRDHSPAGKVDIEAPLYRHLCESTGLPRRAKQGWTDVARFTALGVPALNWGPGNPELAHTQEEWVAVENVERCLERMKAFFLGPGPA
jgi:succinyl-diaminopimelate desuccinylase